MTIKKRLFWSNIMMILVPVIAAAIVGASCIGFIWLTLVHGLGLGIHEPEEFTMVSEAVTEAIEYSLEKGSDLSSMETLFSSNHMTVKICTDTETVYFYGEQGADDEVLLQASDLLNGDATITQGGKSLYVKTMKVSDTKYTVYLFGTYDTVRSYSNLKIAGTFVFILIVFAIFLSILLTNRFLTKFVLKRIEEPLDILADGVHEIRDGNLDYRIAYDRQDEFQPVCEDFNEMARKLKELVRQIQQQEQSRKELIAGISHDIRSPLTSIRAYVEGLLDGIAKTPESQKMYLETIRTKAGDLEHMVSQLFLFSKMELGEYPENPCELRLDDTISHVVSGLLEEYRQKGLDIHMELEPAALYVDPVQIQRITANILENSLKYKDKEQGNIWINLRKTAQGCRLSFADDGPGVPQEALPHLFEVFYRSDPARQNPNKGSGLGLAIVANAVERTGGRIEALKGTAGGLEIRIDFLDEVREYGENPDHRG